MNSTIFQSVIIENQQRNIPKYVKRELQIPDVTFSATAIVGCRRSGKTFRTYQFRDELKQKGIDSSQICRIQFNDLRIIRMQTSDLLQIDQSYYALYPEYMNRKDVYFIFDEIQRLEGWEDYVLQLIDNEKHHVIITGSTSKILSGKIAAGLRGKCISTQLHPFSFREFARYNSIEVDTVSPSGVAYSKSLLAKFLLHGGFSGTYELEDFQKTELLQSYWETMLLRDVLESHPEIAIQFEVLRFFSQALISRVGCATTINKLKENGRAAGLKFSDEIPSKILSFLEEAFVLYSVQFFSPSERIRNRHYQKIYACDWALAKSVGFAGVLNEGALFENLVCIELKRRKYKVSYYLTKQGYEIDFVVQNFQNSLIAQYQACHTLTDSNRLRETRGIVDTAKKFGIEQNFIITYDQQETIVLDGVKIEVIPLWKWLLMA